MCFFKGLNEAKDIETRNESMLMNKKLEEIHAKFDRAQIELASVTEEREKFEVESRKFRNQLDHARQSLDNTYESESRMRQEMELMKRDMSKLQDKLDQSEAELRRVTREKEQMSNDAASAAKLKVNYGRFWSFLVNVGPFDSLCSIKLSFFKAFFSI